MIKRALLALVGAAVALVGLIGVEVLIALRRDFLPTEPALVIEGTYGTGPTLRFVVMGDSTAAGLGTDELHSYPTLLAQRLAATGRRVELTSLGVSGARVKDVLVEQFPRLEALDPQLVFIGIGANDATHLTSLASVRSDMSELIGLVKTTGASLVVAGAPDMRAEAFLQPLRSLAGFRGRQVTDAISAVATEAGVAVVPLAKLTGPFFDEDPDAHYAADRFHPNANGYARWADAIAPYLEDAIP